MGRAREEYQRDPVRCEYLLTEKGRDFFGVIAAINAWGDRWMSDDDGVPVVMRHETCGHDLYATVVCQSCAELKSATGTYRSTWDPAIPLTSAATRTSQPDLPEHDRLWADPGSGVAGGRLIAQR